MDERIGGSTEHLGPTTDCQPKVGLSGVTVPHFQQTGGEVGSRQRIFRREGQGAPEGVRGKSNLAVQEKDASERCQDIRTVPRKLLCLQQDCACLAAIVAMHVEAGQIKLQVDTLWCERERVFEDVDCLAKTSIPGKLPASWRAVARRRSSFPSARRRAASNALPRRISMVGSLWRRAAFSSGAIASSPRI